MKTLRRLSAATILSLTLAISVFGGAGHIETPGAPRPSSTSTTTSTTDVTTEIVLTVVSVIYP